MNIIFERYLSKFDFKVFENRNPKPVIDRVLLKFLLIKMLLIINKNPDLRVNM